MRKWRTPLFQPLHHLFVREDGGRAVEVRAGMCHWRISYGLYILMRMNLATDSLMERFLAYLLAHPERFARSEVPCCLQALWEEALEGEQADQPYEPEHQAGRSCSTNAPRYRTAELNAHRRVSA